MTTHQIEWRLKDQRIPGGTRVYQNWTELEGECYDRADWAEARRKYWQNTSLATVLDFRVAEREEQL